MLLIQLVQYSHDKKTSSQYNQQNDQLANNNFLVYVFCANPQEAIKVILTKYVVTCLIRGILTKCLPSVVRV